MRENNRLLSFILMFVLALLTACRQVATTTQVSSTATMTKQDTVSSRVDLTTADLVSGFEPVGIIPEEALTMPEDALASPYNFEGRLELLGEAENGGMTVLLGSLSDDYKHLPEFDYGFVQIDDYLVPNQRGLIITEQPTYNFILEPGRIWQEPGDEEFSRVSLPFALVFKGQNALLNGTLTFLFDGESVSKVWYQVTQETTQNTKANLWGLLDATYHPKSIPNAEAVREAFRQELAQRFPTQPIEALAEKYPGIDISAFGEGVTSEDMAWYGVVMDGINYLGGCQTRAGTYPYCEWMRQPSYSVAKSTFPALALMRLTQVYGPQVPDLLIKDYVPESAQSSGDWQSVTFNNTIDMATGNYESSSFMVDDNGDRMGEFFGSAAYTDRIAEAFDWPHKEQPGETWVYRTSDTFIVTRAMQNYLQSQTGSDDDIFQYVVDEIYKPLNLSPGSFTSMRTAENNWQGQAEGGYGLWWTPDDIAKLTTFLLNGGVIDSEQILDPDLLAATLQQDPTDRGLQIGTNSNYNNAFWAQHFGPNQGFSCEFWVTDWQGISGNVVVLMPNELVYYYFSDSHDFVFGPAVMEADKISPFCP